LATIYREIDRGSIDGCYCPLKAQEGARQRWKVTRRPSKDTPACREAIAERLRADESPDSITGRQGAENGVPVPANVIPPQPDGSRREATLDELSSPVKKRLFPILICRATIYNIIEKDRREGGNMNLLLPKNGKRNRKKRGSKTIGGPGKLPVQPDQEHKNRPVGVEARDVPGHLEVDLVDAGGTWFLTAVDRVTRFCHVRALPTKEAEPIAQVIEELCLLTELRTITLDRGLEWFRLFEVERRLKVSGIKLNLYFCAPYHSWEKGSIEQFNGLLRKYFPKRVNHAWSEDRHEQAKRAQDRLNSIPRKILGYLTPAEAAAQWEGKSKEDLWRASMRPPMATA
jgi:transposase, IS30 family